MSTVSPRMASNVRLHVFTAGCPASAVTATAASAHPGCLPPRLPARSALSRRNDVDRGLVRRQACRPRQNICAAKTSRFRCEGADSMVRGAPAIRELDPQARQELRKKCVMEAEIRPLQGNGPRTPVMAAWATSRGRQATSRRDRPGHARRPWTLRANYSQSAPHRPSVAPVSEN